MLLRSPNKILKEKGETMQLNVDIPEKDLIELGKETIQREIEKLVKWLKIKRSVEKISKDLQSFDERFYYEEVEKVREASWEEYKADLEK